MADLQREFEELQRRVAELTQRVYKLETAAGIARPEPVAPPPPPARETEGAKPTVPPPVMPVKQVPPAAPPPPPLSGMQREIPAPVETERDLEAMLGGQWLNRIGIAALLIGAAYFLKLAFDNGWIGPSGRVAIGLLAGIVMVIWGERLHARSYRYFGYSMTSVGVGIMYLSLWAAFQLYHLVPSGVAFVAMIAVTASTAVLAVRGNAQVLAAVALAGGFATPTLLSTGENRAVELFSYLLILDVFVIVLATFRPWRRLLAASFAGTIIYFFGWLERFYADDQRTIATVIASGIFVLFLALPLLRQLQDAPEERETVPPPRSKTLITIAVLNPIIYFGTLYGMYQRDYQETLAWVAVVLAAVYIALGRELDRHLTDFPDEERVEKWLHLALGLGFLTLAIPIKLDGHWITMGWLIEAGLLLWVGHRVRSDFLKYAALMALGLGIVRLVFVDDYATTRLFANWRFATYIVAIGVLASLAWAIREEHGSRSKPFTVALICINVLGLIALNLEVHDFFARLAQPEVTFIGDSGYQRWAENERARDFTYSALWMLYGAGCLVAGFWRKLASLRWQGLALIGVTIVKVFLYDLSNLTGALRVLSFIALGALLMGISFLYQKGWLNAADEEK